MLLQSPISNLKGFGPKISRKISEIRYLYSRRFTSIIRFAMNILNQNLFLI